MSTSATSPFITGERTNEGFYQVQNGLEPCIARAKAYAPYSDLIWMETGTPDLELAKKFAEGVKSRVPRPDAGLQLLAVVQLESSTWTTRPSPSSSASWARWASSSSSSPWPASTP